MSGDDVLIIGGGISGLAAAMQCQRLGLTWRLVEARARLGGRILSARDDDGSAFDLGPAWIWPHQRRIQALVADLGLQLFAQHSTGTLAFEDAAGQVQRDLAFAPMAGTLRVVGGLQGVTDALAARLPTDHLMLNHRATAITPQGEGAGFRITLSTPDGGPTHSSARTVILALPPRLVASRIDLSTVCTDVGLEAMRGVPTWMAGHGKLVAVYDTPFWRAIGLSGDAISHRGPLMEVHDACPGGEREGEGAGALFGFLHPAIVAQMPDEADLKQAALHQLEALFGADAARPRALFLKNWLADDNTALPSDAMGQDHPPGGVPAPVQAMAQRGILFAGAEVAAEDPGLIEGALAASDHAVAGIKRLIA